MESKFTLQILPIAVTDLESIYKYINEELTNTKAAKDLMSKVRRSFEQIANFPYSCPACRREKEYRKLIIDNYIAFYKVDEDTKTVLIYRVLYGMMDYEKYL